VDELLDEARVTPDLERRKELYANAIELIWNDAPWLFLHSEVQINAEREGVHGLIHHPLENIFVWEAWIE
jgi:peptide/nickel transport system substrate-binding protein